MNIKDLKVACSPMTNVIYVGKTSKDNTRWVGDKKNVTMDCLIATIEHVLALGTSVEIRTPEGVVDFEITVKDLRVKN